MVGITCAVCSVVHAPAQGKHSSTSKLSSEELKFIGTLNEDLGKDREGKCTVGVFGDGVGPSKLSDAVFNLVRHTDARAHARMQTHAHCHESRTCCTQVQPLLYGAGGGGSDSVAGPDRRAGSPARGCNLHPIEGAPGAGRYLSLPLNCSGPSKTSGQLHLKGEEAPSPAKRGPE
eukprot:1154126-Pelagomonas_calceolata.AAC.2